ncbi:hemolysin family protein [Mycolicibacterium sp. 120270]|uniref:hemolysin family protein n=1 Tax=Mycolicibacterium sp. 120270 TaxID=3090600 RepID=UPI00299F3A57|nr:hemolysin family protein [Mycolicibacterium sp. 120270]MDX1884984.1 hemolysin family protein [Mycolicibacterium sp. 120270]
MLTALANIGLGVVVVALITAFTAYFVAQEFAYTAVSRASLKAHAEAGDVAAARALDITRRTSFMLSGAQLGITVTGLLAGYVAEPLIGSGLADLLGLASVPTGVAVAVGTAVSLIFCTIVQMLFGELFPKNLAIAIPEPLARRLAVSTSWYLRLFGWLIWFMDQSSNILLRAVKIEPVHDVEQAATARDLEHIVAASSASGEMPRELSTLLGRVLDFPTSTAEHAMIPRTRVDTVRYDDTIDTVLTRMASGHTRYPVVGETIDEVLGVIDLRAVLDADPTDTAGSRCRPAVQVPTSLPLPETLNRLTEAGDELAVVIDEYGGFAGIVTVEDIAEELVGEIADEHDASDSRVVRRSGGWVLPGDLHLDEAQRLLGERLPEGDYETIAGLVMHYLGRLPAVGDRVDIPLPDDPAAWPAEPKVLSAKVESIQRRVPAEVFVTIRTKGDGDE